MSDDLVVTSVLSQDEAFPEVAPADNRLRWFELFLVLLVAFGAFIFSSIHWLVLGETTQNNFQSFSSATGILHESSCLLLLGYILYRRKLRFADIGLRWSWRQVGTGLVVTVVSWIVYWGGASIVTFAHRAIYGASMIGQAAQVNSVHPSLLAIPFVLMNPFFEELIVRAYLMTEMRFLTNSRTLAVLLSTAVQTTYHLYYGWVRALSIMFVFLVYSIYFARKQKALPLIISHGIQDILGIAQYLR